MAPARCRAGLQQLWGTTRTAGCVFFCRKASREAPEKLSKQQDFSRHCPPRSQPCRNGELSDVLRPSLHCCGHLNRIKTSRLG